MYKGNKLTIRDTDVQLLVGVHYYVLYDSDKTNLSIVQLQNQHDVLNACYTATNHDDLKKTPNNYNSIGNANNIFLPLTLDNYVNVTRVKVPNDTSFNGVESVLNYLDDKISDPVIPGKINIYCCSLTNGLLGQAVVGGTTAVVDAGTVGSKNMPGWLRGYNYGKTVVHEVGHIMALLHTFLDNACTQPRAIFDIPRQVEPNSYATIIKDVDGRNITHKGNRERDCNIPRQNKQSSDPPYSCIGYLSADEFNCTDGPWEASFSFMDYSKDDYLLLFSRGQTAVMRDRLLRFNDDLHVFTSQGYQLINTNTGAPAPQLLGMSHERFYQWLIISIVLIVIGGVSSVLYYYYGKH
jgi:hypothetical protein